MFSKLLDNHAKRELRQTIEDLQTQLEAAASLAVLVDIRVQDRKNIFVFLRNGETFTIETYSTMSDDPRGWKHRAGL